MHLSININYLDNFFHLYKNSSAHVPVKGEDFADVRFQ